MRSMPDQQARAATEEGSQIRGPEGISRIWYERIEPFTRHVLSIPLRLRGP
ncbi:hypothetical protein J2W76_003806 [Methylorubrum zatmanii]|nr:hypothetical protein [Methylorubrum zatmanii]MCP1552826.1 hypothetical protein [Methylorubrum extorquens]MCP1580864.1 hypothetical protein [Methylorubrum extorquens]